MAAISLGLTSPEQLRIPHVKQRFDSVVVDCLTTPYDRTLVRCLEETGRTRQCATAFRIRYREAHGEESLPGEGGQERRLPPGSRP